MTIAKIEEGLTPAQAARLVGVSTERIRQLSNAGRLPVTRTALGRLYLQDDIEELVAKRAQRNN